MSRYEITYKTTKRGREQAIVIEGNTMVEAHEKFIEAYRFALIVGIKKI